MKNQVKILLVCLFFCSTNLFSQGKMIEWNIDTNFVLSELSKTERERIDSLIESNRTKSVSKQLLLKMNNKSGTRYDLNLGLINSLTNLGFNIIYGSNALNYGVKTNFTLGSFSSKGNIASITELSCVGGIDISGKSTYGSFDIGLGFCGITKNEIYYKSRSVYTGRGETGWEPFFDNDPNHWSTSTRKYNKEQLYSAFCFPIELKLLYLPNDNFGIGSTLFVNFNTIQTYFGLNLTLTFF